MKDVKTAAEVHKNQTPILSSVKSKLGVSKISKEHRTFNKVFLICYINTQSGRYCVRGANYFQMLKKKKLTTISLHQNDSRNYGNKRKCFETRTNQVKPNKAKRKLEK